MSRIDARLIVTFIISLVVGYVVSWFIMIAVLETELRLYGIANLTVVALLVALTLLIILDGPLRLGTFNWREGFWPKTLELPTARAKRQGRRGQFGNSLKVSGFIFAVVASIASFASLIPQVESPAPETLEISGDLSGPELAALGDEVLNSAEAGCLACHGLGQEGLRAPNLAGIGGRASSAVAGQSAEEYLREALVDPCAFVVEGYDCIMPETLAQSLGSAKITALIAFMQSQGGEITVSLSGEEAVSEEESSTSGSVGIEGTTAEEFFNNAAPACSTCHTLDVVGAAGAVGPDLSQVGARLGTDEIRVSILMPDAVIAEDCPGAPCTPGVMPKTYGDQFTAAQLDTLVTFLSEQQ